MAKELTNKQRIALVRKLSKKLTKKINRNSKVRLSETLYLDKYDNGTNPYHYTDASIHHLQHQLMMLLLLL